MQFTIALSLCSMLLFLHYKAWVALVWTKSRKLIPFMLLLSLGNCGLDLRLIDWRFADKVSLPAFSKGTVGGYFSRYSSKFLSGKMDCGKDQLIITKKSLSLFCGEYVLAHCFAASIVKQEKHYQVLCSETQARLDTPQLRAFKVMEEGPRKPKHLTINYVGKDRIAIINDVSNSMNRIYERKGMHAKEVNF